MARPFPVQAVAPAFGVRVTMENDKVRVQAADSGGRGCPHLAVFVPVALSDDGKALHVFGPNGPIEPRRWADLEKAGAIPLHNPKSESPYPFAIPYGDWPHRAPAVLLLLLYIQNRGIGGDVAAGIAAGAAPTQGALQRALEAVAKAVSWTLKSCTLGQLRGGLIDCTLNGLRRGEGAASRNPTPETITFALASCQYPSDIFDRMPDDEHATRGPADESLLALARIMDGGSGPSLVLLAGDQVYVDATAGLFDPKVLDDQYRIPHERRRESRGAKAALQRMNVPVHMILDDHEIRNNWAPNDPDSERLGSGKTAIERGTEAYFAFERALPKPFPSCVWYDFTHDGFPFFLGDTRTERGPRTALTWHTARIMKPKQCRALCDWMLAEGHADLPKFVLTPSMLLPRRLAVAEDPCCALHSDAWDGYPASLHELLAFVCDCKIKKLVFLSGDEHHSNCCIARVAKGNEKPCVIHSIHSSALYAPYPFANGVKENFASHETFCFPDPRAGPYRCSVKTFFPDAGDGFALVTASRNALKVEFHNAQGPKANHAFQRCL